MADHILEKALWLNCLDFLFYKSVFELIPLNVCTSLSPFGTFDIPVENFNVWSRFLDTNFPYFDSVLYFLRDVNKNNEISSSCHKVLACIIAGSPE